MFLQFQAAMSQQLRTGDNGDINLTLTVCAGSGSSTVMKRKRTNADMDPVFVEQGDSKKKGALEGTGGFPFHLKPRWRNIHMQYTDQAGKNDISGKQPAYSPDDNSNPLFAVVENDDISDCQCCDAETPKSPTFRLTASHYSNKGTKCEDSPACVVGQPIGNTSSAYFWQRSMAWSDDDCSDDCSDYECQDTAFRNHNIFTTSLNLPISNSPFVPRHRDALPRRCHDGDQSNHILIVDEMRSLDKPPTLPRSYTSEIFWEEKVLDSSDLERMAKLSL